MTAFFLGFFWCVFTAALALAIRAQFPADVLGDRDDETMTFALLALLAACALAGA